MLAVDNLAMGYKGEGGRLLFQHLSFTLPKAGRIGVLGRNGQGKSTLIKILGGILMPTAGRVDWSMSPSWPLGFGGGFQGGMTGLDNIRFISRIYDQPLEPVIQATEDFAQLGEALKMEVKYYSSGMRARLAFGLSLAIEFDCYLIDEVIAVGDAGFQAKCQDELFGRRADRAFVIASHDLAFIHRTCDRAIIIDDGRAQLFEDVGLAINVYAALAAPELAAAFLPLEPESGLHAKNPGPNFLPHTRFVEHDTSDQVCPEEIEIAGPMRVLVFGPMIVAPAGRVRATLRFWLSAEAIRVPYNFQLLFGAAYVEQKFKPTGEGRYVISLELDSPVEAPVAIRLWNLLAAFSGALRFEGAEIVAL
jgi:capsular polysaccharide transport system ATP-binding protein